MPQQDSPTIFCLTPVKNESWILARFIECASTWADHIIIADQYSDDGSREIASRYSKVTLIDNDSAAYDEGARVNLLLRTARSIPCDGKRIFISLDADEALSANWSTASEWQSVLEAPSGTVLGFDWLNVLPGYTEAFIPEETKWFGYVDAGEDFEARVIHSPRLPWSPDAPQIILKDIKALHFQYTDWKRMRSKQRWYQVWERIKFPDKRASILFRQYNHMMAIPPNQKCAFENRWLDAYEESGIDMRSIPEQDFYWWDEEVVDLLAKHGPGEFRRIAIWDEDWDRVASLIGREELVGKLSDPRSNTEKRIMKWFGSTQASRYSLSTRIVQKLLQPFAW